MKSLQTQTSRISVSVNGTKSYYTKKDFSSLDQNKCIDKLAYGTMVKKITKKGNGSLRSVLFYINEDDPSQLQWLSTVKEYWRSRIDLLKVKTITERPMSKLTKKAQAHANNLLCIYYGADEELLLVFDNPNDKLEWWCGLQYFIVRAHEKLKMAA